MTAPNIRTDHTAAAAAATELRRIAAELPGAVAPITEAVAAAAMKPLPTGVVEGPEMAIMQDLAKQLETLATTTASDLTVAAATVATWDRGIGSIDDGAAGGVAAQGGGGS